MQEKRSHFHGPGAASEAPDGFGCDGPPKAAQKAGPSKELPSPGALIGITIPDAEDAHGGEDTA